MGNSEVGHNALGAGRIFAQGQASLPEYFILTIKFYSIPFFFLPFFFHRILHVFFFFWHSLFFPSKNSFWKMNCAPSVLTCLLFHL